MLQRTHCATSQVWHLSCGVAFVQFVISLILGDGKIFPVAEQMDFPSEELNPRGR